MADNEKNEDQSEVKALFEDTFNEVQSLGDVLGDSEDQLYTKRLGMDSISGQTYLLTRAQWRDRKTGGYYILHITNINGMEGTTTTSAPKIKAKLSALINREAFPVRVQFVSDGQSYNMVNPGG